MSFAQSDELAVIVEDLRIALEVVPVEAVYRVGRPERVVLALLVAQHLLARENERHALRCEHRCLCQQVEAYKLVVADVGYGCTQTVGQTQVVMAADVGNHL